MINLNSFRIGIDRWMPADEFDQLLGTFDRFACMVDQIQLFSSETHPPLPLEVVIRRMSVAKNRIAQAKSRGYSCGINVLATLGHHNEDLDNSLQGAMTRMTNINGETCRGSICPNDPLSREYIRELYDITARANPDFIWIDDDVRFGHMPIGFGCFCDNCLDIFAGEYGRRYTKTQLEVAFCSDDKPAMLNLRKQWLEHNRNTIDRLFALIESTVHAINPGIAIGFMTGERYYEGYGFGLWAHTLHSSGGKVFWRPGGGAYSDRCLKDMVDKAHEIGRQVANLPDFVEVIQSEIENFPYQMIKKGPSATAMEAALYIAAGATGTAFNVLPFYNENIETFAPLLKKISETTPFYHTLSDTLGRHKLLGIHTGWGIDSMASSSYDHGNMIEQYPSSAFADELFELGLPIAYNDQGAQVYALTRTMILAMSRERIEDILKLGVYLEPEAIDQLNKMGYAHLVGFKVGTYFDADCIELYTDHPMNAGFALGKRNCRQAFYRGSAASIIPLNDRCETLSSIVDYHNNTVATITMGIFVNECGGRICAAGYYPFGMIQDSLKSEQLKRVFLWLSKNTLPSYVKSFTRVNNWSRMLPNGKVALAILNSTLDTRSCEVFINTHATIATAWDMSNTQSTLCATARNGEYALFETPEMPPWSIVLILT